jgi:hypothetical protein
MVDPEQLAAPVVEALLEQEAVDFVYGQGSAFAGFADAADLDLVVVWHRLPVRRIGGLEVSASFEGATYALDKLAGEVDVMHFTCDTFTSWCGELSWREEVWPQPLYVVGGFVHGRVLADPQGHAQKLLQNLQTPAPWFVAQVTDSLRDGLGGYRTELQACARRGDHWLFNRLTDRLLRHCYIAWFALEGHYCPFPKHLPQWIQRLGLSSELAELHDAVWATPGLHGRAEALEAFARRLQETSTD